MRTEVIIKEEKKIRIEDISHGDNIAFIDTNGRKVYLIAVGYKSVMFIGIDEYRHGNTTYGKHCETIEQAIKGVSVNCNEQAQIATLYRFDTRKELYAWLAE